MRYITRVVLHDAKDESYYDDLHAAMAKAGFVRTIQGANGRVYHLPPATYAIEGNYTTASVREHARKAADSTKKRNSVLTTEGDSAWVGLTEVQPVRKSILQSALRGY